MCWIWLRRSVSTLQTLTDLHSNYVSEDTVQVVIEYKYGQTCAHTRESRWNPKSDTLEPDRSQHDRHTTRVIAQQCYYATFVSLSFSPRKNMAPFKNVVLLISYFFKSLCLKLRKSGSVCSDSKTIPIQGASFKVLLSIFFPSFIFFYFFWREGFHEEV
jgi:hypothetical protein